MSRDRTSTKYEKSTLKMIKQKVKSKTKKIGAIKKDRIFAMMYVCVNFIFFKNPSFTGFAV